MCLFSQSAAAAFAVDGYGINQQLLFDFAAAMQAQAGMQSLTLQVVQQMSAPAQPSIILGFSLY